MDAVSYSNSNTNTGEPGSGRNDLTILDCFDRPIAFHRCFVTLTGSVTAALMLSQAYYWQKRAKSHDGWWFKTRDDWIEETGMGRREQEGARKKLRALGILREDLRGVPATLWYKVEETKLLEAIANLSNPASSSPTLPTPVGTKPPFQLVRNRPTGRAETAQLEGRKPPNKLGQIAPTSNETETTTETTTENTTPNGVVANTFAKPKASRPHNGILQGEELENWLNELQNDFAYASIAVRMEYAKMLRWCEANKRQPTKRRFISWLNRIDTVSQPAQTKQETPQEREARLKALWEGKRAA